MLSPFLEMHFPISLHIELLHLIQDTDEVLTPQQNALLYSRLLESCVYTHVCILILYIYHTLVSSSLFCSNTYIALPTCQGHPNGFARSHYLILTAIPYVVLLLFLLYSGGK